MTRSRGTLSIIGVLLLLLAAWQTYIWVSHVPSYVLPTPLQTAQAVAGNLSLLLERSLVTLEGAVLGLGASIVLAVSLALIIVRWPLAEHVILTYALLIRTLPIVGVAPIVTLVTGRGLTTSVLCVLVITVFSLLVSVIQGFESVPAEITELGDLYATPFRRRFRIALLPGATASLLQGLRVAAPLAVLGALLAEWLDGFNGIGSLMISANADQEIQLLMAACLTAVVLSLVAFALVELATVIAARHGHLVDQMAIGSR
ncbi:MAG: transporter permease [Acidimicrobiaceae bacterium]|jgi:ABC-type nitrate/sulfonate/bicarbonate transport system permease component|nr:transporter permease [Acidimicrobiaceae bacterium]